MGGELFIGREGKGRRGEEGIVIMVCCRSCNRGMD